MTTTELHTLTGAYAVQALQPDEETAFERHLSDCTACTLEVAELRATAARLGLAVAEQPPGRMRTQVLHRIGEVRQEPPPRSPHTEDASGAPARRGTARRSARAWPTLALAACLAVAAGFGGVAVWQYQQAEQARHSSRSAENRAAQLAEVLSAPDARTVPAPHVPGDGSGTVVVSRKEDRAAFVASRMPRPPEGRTYQLWYADHGTMRSAGLMDSGSTDAWLLDGPLGDASGMGITVEPGGGSAKPTSDPVVLVNFPSQRA